MTRGIRKTELLGLGGVILPFFDRLAYLSDEATRALGKVNQAIFADIHPVLEFYNDAPECFARCASTGGLDPAIPRKLQLALLKIHGGDIDGGSHMIAEYEQHLVQIAVYENPEVRLALGLNELGAKARAPGTERTEVALTSACDDRRPVSFDGLSILDEADRVKYYHRLAREFDRQMASEPSLLSAELERVRARGQPRGRLYSDPEMIVP